MAWLFLLYTVFQREKAINFGEVQGKTFPSTLPGAPGIMRFSSLSGGSRHHYLTRVGVGTVRSSPLGRLLPWPCVDPDSAKYTQGASAGP